MATIGELIINIKADTAAFAGELSKVKNLSFDTASQIQRSFQIIGTAAVGMLATFGASMVAMIDKSVEFETHVLHLSEAAGVTTETMSGLGFAAKMMGLNIDDVAKGMERFDKQLLQAQQGKSASVDLMARLGIDPKTIGTSDEALTKLADHFAKMPDGALKTGEALAAFGRAGAAMIPILNQGSAGIQAFMDQAKALGLIIDEKTAKSAQHFEQSLTVLKGAFEGMGLQIANQLLPTLQNYVDQISRSGPEMVKFIGFVVTASRDLLNLGDALVFVARVANASVNLAFSPTKIREFSDYVKQAYADMQRFDAFKQADASASSFLDTVRKLSTAEDDLNLQTKKQRTEIENIAKKYDELAAAAGRTGLNVDLYKMSVDHATFAEMQHVLQIGLVTEKLKASATALQQLATIRDYYAGTSAAGEEFTKVLKDQQKAAIAAVDALDPLKLVPMDLSNISTAAANLSVPMTVLTHHGERLNRIYRQFGDQVARDFVDLTSGAKALSSIMTDLLKQIEEALVKMALFGNGSSGTGGLLGMIGNFAMGIFGGLRGPLAGAALPISYAGAPTGGASLMGFAGGGGVGGGSPIMVGESGPEMFVPDTSGTIIPHGDLAGGMTHVTIVHNIDARGADPSVDRKIREAMKQTHERSVKDALALSREMTLRTA